MAIYSGTGTYSLDLIARYGITKKRVLEIYNELCEPKIGELKITSGLRDLSKAGLVKTAGIWRLDNTQKFDGWVYPDGSAFSKADFPKAFEEFGTSGDTFNVPSIDNVFFSGSDQPFGSVAGKSGLARHNHPLTSEKGVPINLNLKNGFVFCAAGNYGGTRVQKYYTHPAIKYAKYNRKGELTAIVDISAHYGISATGAYRPVSIISNDVECEPNLSAKPAGMPIEEWSLEYTVPTFHSGNNKFKHVNQQRPMMLDMTLKVSDVAAWFEGGKTNQPTQSKDYPYDIDTGLFEPESQSIPVMIYIGSHWPDIQ